MSVEIKLNIGGLNRLMRSQAVQNELNRRAAKIATAAGPKFGMKPNPHKWTARAYVQSLEGQRLTDDDVRRLQAAIDAGRG